jgi:hypothetical protein
MGQNRAFSMQRKIFKRNGIGVFAPPDASIQLSAFESLCAVPDNGCSAVSC